MKNVLEIVLVNQSFRCFDKTQEMAQIVIQYHSPRVGHHCVFQMESNEM